MMAAGHRLCRNFKLLKKLKKASRSQRKKILEAANNDFILCLCDCAHNILKGNVTLKPKEKTKLSRHKQILRNLASGGNPKNITKKRKLLIQKGGF